MKRSLVALALLLAGCGEPYYKGPVSDHFDGEHFFNPGHPQVGSFWRVLQWKFLDSTPRPEWPLSVAVSSPTIPAATVSGTALTVTAMGHASFLIQTEGLNILTDPVFTERASPFESYGPKRVTAFPYKMAQLPRIDIILVSHNHYDHMSIPTLKQLWERDKPRIIVPLGNDTILRRGGIPSEAFDWAQSTELSKTVTAHLHPVQHWSARWLNDRRKALWTGYTLTTPGGNILFAGDTGYGDGWWSKPLAEKFGSYRLALMPIGAYEPRWFMKYSHMNPEEAVQAAQDVKAQNLIGMHWGTFRLTNEGYEEPAEHFTAALTSTTTYTPQNARAMRPGEAWKIPQ